MIASLRGRILGNADQQLIVEVGGVGFAVTTSPGVRQGNEIGGEIFLFTALIVREDAFTLFGYQTSTERDLFQLLQTVSGIGPKVSHAILSTLTVSEIVAAISVGDNRALEQVSGLGKKGAQRIILELKDRIAGYGSAESVPSVNAAPTDLSLAQALSGLGFTSREIEHALDIVKNSATTSLEEGLKIALAALHNGGPRV